MRLVVCLWMYRSLCHVIDWWHVGYVVWLLPPQSPLGSLPLRHDTPQGKPYRKWVHDVTMAKHFWVWNKLFVTTRRCSRQIVRRQRPFSLSLAMPCCQGPLLRRNLWWRNELVGGGCFIYGRVQVGVEEFLALTVDEELELEWNRLKGSSCKNNQWSIYLICFKSLHWF